MSTSSTPTLHWKRRSRAPVVSKLFSAFSGADVYVRSAGTVNSSLPAARRRTDLDAGDIQMMAPSHAEPEKPHAVHEVTSSSVARSGRPRIVGPRGRIQERASLPLQRGDAH